MNEFSLSLFAVAIALGGSFLGPFVAYHFLAARRRQARQRRRSPLGMEMLREPGHLLRKQIDDAQVEVLGLIFGLSLGPALMAAVVAGQHLLSGRAPSPGLVLVLGVALVGGLIYALLELRHLGAKLDNLRLGYDAELAVGQELDQLMLQGARVFHDVPAEDFNIDHVVVAAQGVFAVETKGFAKPIRGLGKKDATVSFDGKVLSFPHWSSSEPLEQAQKQAAWLSKWLASASGAPVRVLPVLALPGWFVDLRGRGDVRVYSGKQLGGLLDARGTQGLSQQMFTAVVHQLDQRCRTVTPLFASEKKGSLQS